MASLADELRMTKPFATAEEEAILSVVKTAEVLAGEMADLLKALDLSAAQYNVLRILRGSKDGLPCGEIAGRMVNRDPDITRLLDRLEQQGLTTRERDPRDRRVVRAQITAIGLKRLQELEPTLSSFRRDQFSDFTQSELETLIQLLQRMREHHSTSAVTKKETKK
jgi:DNA-binding MarR family transcriptional regulator